MLVINFLTDPHFCPTTPSSRKDNYPESIMKKYMSIPEYSPCNVQIIGGDNFHRSLLPLKYINWVANETRKLQERYGYTTYVIPGNHDCLYSNIDYMEESAIGNFLATGLVQRLETLELVIEPGYIAKIVGWNFSETEPPEASLEENTCNILVGHAFYETAPTKNKDLLITRDQIAESNYDMVLLGHDHSKFEPSVVTGSRGPIMIYRPGGFSRGTSHYTQVWREVSIVRIELSVVDGKIFKNVSYVNIPSIPPEQAFVGVAREGKRAEIKKAMEEFVKGVTLAEVEFGEIEVMLKELNLDNELNEYVRSLLHSYGLINIKGEENVKKDEVGETF